VPEPSSIADEVEQYLRTGHTDSWYAAWPGAFFDRAERAHADLRGALLREVKRLTEGRAHPPLPRSDTVALTRAKVEPLVRGLFPRAEQEVVLATLEKSVVFVTSDNLEALLLEPGCDHTAWAIANLYLVSLDVDVLSEEAPRIVGMSEDRTCYVTPAYFAEEDPFADFIVHEVAHIFHNCKRRTIGLKETRRKEWLLDIEFRRREEFAYACEAYSRILAQAKTAAERRALATEYGRIARISADRVDPAEVAEILVEAAAVRNGWKAILARCAPARRPRSAVSPITSSWPAEERP
jgi:hypothetical protein